MQYSVLCTKTRGFYEAGFNLWIANIFCIMGIIFDGGIMNKIPYVAMGRKDYISQEDAETIKQHNDYWCDKYQEEKFTVLRLREHIKKTEQQYEKNIARLEKSILLRDVTMIVVSFLIVVLLGAL